MENPILKNLNDKQIEAVTCTSGALLVIAGAGSGKTRALTHRIAYLIQNGVSPWNILAVTFTNKAANEMKERIVKLVKKIGSGASAGLGGGRKNQEAENQNLSFVKMGEGPIGGQDFSALNFSSNFSDLASDYLPTIGTFHSVCVRILRKHIKHLDYESGFAIYDDTDQQILMKKLMEGMGIDNKKMNPKTILGVISNAKNQLIDEKQFAKYVDGMFMEKVASLYGPYQKALKQNNALDFDDIIMKTVELFKNFPEILDYYQEKFRYISVDEYQDTNHAQYMLIKLLAAKYKNICVIGDEDQSIYSWRGATIKNILEFEKDYPDAKVIFMEQNYRSSKNILDAAHSVISKNRNRKDKKLWTDKKGGAKIFRWLAHNEKHESELIAKEVVELLKQYESPKYSDFVVLYRTNAQSRVLEEVFLRYGLPYRIVGGIKFYERKEIKDMLSYLRVLQNPSDSVSLSRIINVPARKIGAKTMELIQDYATSGGTAGSGISGGGMSMFAAMQEIKNISGITDSKIEDIEKFVKLIFNLKELNAELPASGVIKHVLEDAHYREFLDDGTIEGESRLQNVQELISVASKYDSLEPGVSLAVFLEEVSLISDLDKTSDDKNAVTFMTVHSAKGLEFPYVFIAGLEDGIFPHNRSLMDPSQLEEERRLMYVAMTRAMEKLYLIHALERMLYGEFRANAPSQFLEDIPKELVEDNFGGHGLPGNKIRSVFGAYGGVFGGAAGGSMGRSGRSSSYAGFGGGSDIDYASTGMGDAPVPYEEGFSTAKASLEDTEYEEVKYSVGDRVLHNAFGEGVVVDIKGGVATVAFNDPKVGVKKLALSVAPLKKI